MKFQLGLKYNITKSTYVIFYLDVRTGLEKEVDAAVEAMLCREV